MFDLAEQHLPTLLPLRNSRFSRPRRRIQMTTDRRMCMHASLLNGPSTSGVLGSISAVFPMSDVLAGAAARAASQSTIHPLDTIKVRMQASLKGNTARTLSAAAVSGTAVSGGKYGIGIGQASATAARTPRSVAFATGAVLGKLGAEVGSLYKGVLGAASGAGIAI